MNTAIHDASRARLSMVPLSGLSPAAGRHEITFSMPPGTVVSALALVPGVGPALVAIEPVTTAAPEPRTFCALVPGVEFPAASAERLAFVGLIVTPLEHGAPPIPVCIYELKPTTILQPDARAVALVSAQH